MESSTDELAKQGSSSSCLKEAGSAIGDDANINAVPLSKIALAVATILNLVCGFGRFLWSGMGEFYSSNFVALGGFGGFVTTVLSPWRLAENAILPKAKAAMAFIPKANSAMEMSLREKSVVTGSKGDKMLDADKEDSGEDPAVRKRLTNQEVSSRDPDIDADKHSKHVLWAVLIQGRKFVGALVSLPQSLLRCFSNLPSDFRQGFNCLARTKLCEKSGQICLFLSICFSSMSGIRAQDEIDNGKARDPKVWKTNDIAKVTVVTLLASCMGVYFLYKRRNTFSEDDIDEGLMNGPAVVRRNDPAFALLPPIEPWSDEE